MKTTPIEKYDNIFVKREDMCFDPPAPPFSKCRGIIIHLKKLRDSGIKTVGYVETSISMAGWGVAWACSQLGLKAVIFDPQYKNTPETLNFHRSMWAMFDCVEIVPIKAGMAKVNWYVAQSILKNKYHNSTLLPLGLPFPETIEETAKETMSTFSFLKEHDIKTIFCCVGSGTIIAGIYKGLQSYGQNINLIGVMSRTGDARAKLNGIVKKSGVISGPMFSNNVNLRIYDDGWEYTEPSQSHCPFPCHKFYDLKAWEFLKSVEKSTLKNILFWNIGK